MDRKAFYASLRKRDSGVFGTSLSQGQVDGTENLLNVWEKYIGEGEADELSYDLGTSYHETAHTMQPITERGPRSYFNKYEPGTRIGKVLGNTQPGDGYRFRGEGHVQNTGRRNAGVATRRLNELFGLGIDLVANPGQRGDPLISALSLFIGNREGWWTGKDLGRYLDGVDESEAEDLREFINARYVVNGTDKARLIAGYAAAFKKALDAAGYEPRRATGAVPPPPDIPAPEQPGESGEVPAPARRPGTSIPGLIWLGVFLAAAIVGLAFAAGLIRF